MLFLKDLREKSSIKSMFLEILVSPSIFTINPSISFSESSNAMPFSGARTKIALERSSASITLFAITEADIELVLEEYPVLGLRI
jgi:hypothetical protein